MKMKLVTAEWCHNSAAAEWCGPCSILKNVLDVEVLRFKVRHKLWNRVRGSIHSDVWEEVKKDVQDLVHNRIPNKVQNKVVKGIDDIISTIKENS